MLSPLRLTPACRLILINMSETLTELPFGTPGRVYRSPMPFGAFDEAQDVFHQYIQAGVKVVVMLVSDAEAQTRTGRDLRALYLHNGLQVIYMPTPDFGVPDCAPFEQALSLAQAEAGSGRDLVVHCNAGIGRTGLFLACLARRSLGMNAEQAVAWVREYIPHAVENEAQFAFIQQLDEGEGGSSC